MATVRCGESPPGSEVLCIARPLRRALTRRMRAWRGRTSATRRASQAAPEKPAARSRGAVSGACFLTRSPPASGSCALTIKTEKDLDYMRLLSHALRAIRRANVRFPDIAGAMFDPPAQSRFRGNDDRSDQL